MEPCRIGGARGRRSGSAVDGGGGGSNSVHANPSAFRANVAQTLQDEFFAGSAPSMAADVEKSIYNYAVREACARNAAKSWESHYFCLLYENRWRTVVSNLRSNAQLLGDVRSLTLSARQLSSMTHSDMDPARWRARLEAKRIKDLSRFSADERASTDMFECRNCRSRRCQYYEMQIRSADESCSYFVNCLDCGKHWRVN